MLLFGLAPYARVGASYRKLFINIRDALVVEAPPALTARHRQHEDDGALSQDQTHEEASKRIRIGLVHNDQVLAPVQIMGHGPIDTTPTNGHGPLDTTLVHLQEEIHSRLSESAPTVSVGPHLHLDSTTVIQATSHGPLDTTPAVTSHGPIDTAPALASSPHMQVTNTNGHDPLNTTPATSYGPLDTVLALMVPPPMHATSTNGHGPLNTTPATSYGPLDTVSDSGPTRQHSDALLSHVQATSTNGHGPLNMTPATSYGPLGTAPALTVPPPAQANGHGPLNTTPATSYGPIDTAPAVTCPKFLYVPRTAETAKVVKPMKQSVMFVNTTHMEKSRPYLSTWALTRHNIDLKRAMLMEFGRYAAKIYYKYNGHCPPKHEQNVGGGKLVMVNTYLPEHEYILQEAWNEFIITL